MIGEAGSYARSVPTVERPRQKKGLLLPENAVALGERMPAIKTARYSD